MYTPELLQKHYPTSSSVEIQLFDYFLNYGGHERFTVESDCTPICWKVSPTLATFIRQSETALYKSLQQLHVQIIYDIEEELIYLLPQIQSKQLANWSKECIKRLDLFLKDVTDTSLKVHKLLRSKLQETINETSLFYVEFAKDHNELQVAGYSVDVTKLIEKIKYIEDTELIQEEFISLDKKKITYISQMQIDKLRKDHPDFIIEANIEESVILLRGNKCNMEALKQKVIGIEVFSCLIALPLNVVKYLLTSHTQNIITKSLGNHSLYATVYFEKDTQTFFAIAGNELTATKLAEHLEKIIGYDELIVVGDSMMYCDQSYLEFCIQIRNTYIVDIVKSENENKIKLYGNHLNIPIVKQKLNDFIKHELIEKKRIRLDSNAKWRLLSLLIPEWNHITEQLKPGSKYDGVLVQFPSINEFFPTIIGKYQKLHHCMMR